MMILLADIGGTHARLAYLKSNKIGDITVLKCNDFKGPIELLKNFIQNQKLSGIVLSVAGPVYKGKVQWTNRPEWQLSEAELKKKFNIRKAFIVNDMVAQAYGLKRSKNQKALLMNVGTGLGTSLILNCQVYPLEFGSVLDEKNRKKEYYLSGHGIVHLYHELGGNRTIRSAKILDEMRQNKDKIAIKAYQKFYELWGKTAGNLATGLLLTHVYLWGGLAPKNKNDMRFFLKAFYNKKLPNFNQKILVKIIREKSLSFNGLMNLLMHKSVQS